MSETIGFVGLGIMGRGMVSNLLKAGFTVNVWNRTASRIDEMVAQGAVACTSSADVAQKSTTICLCVSDTPDVEQVILGEGGILEGAKAGSLIIDLSTISPQTTQKIAATLAEKGLQMLDAPVSGGSEGAAKGTLSIMVGGDEAAFARGLPVLQAMGKTITHMGGSGAGQMVKLVNQILVVGNMLAVSEALIFAQAGGLDLTKTIQAVAGGAAGSWMLSNRGTQAIVRDFRPGFTIDLQQKDLRLVLESADALGAPVVTTSLISQMYRTLQAAGLGGEGNHGLIKALERLAGFEVGKTPDAS